MGKAQFFKAKLSTTVSIKRSRRELSFDVVVDRDTFQTNQITLFLEFYSKQV